MRPIGDLAADERNAITDGPFGSKLKTEHYTASGPRVIRLANIGDSCFVDVQTHISEEHFATLQKHRVFPGDLVIAALGENPPRSCIVPDFIGPAIVKADCVRFKPGPMLLPKFVNYAINSDFTRRSLRGVVHGVGRPRLNLREIKAIEIPVPSLGEQQRIVAEIDKQFTRLDAAVASARRVHANIKRYRAAVLQHAFVGSLNGESRVETSHEGEGVSLPRVPKTWEWVTLDGLASSSSYGTSEKCSYDNDGPPVLRIPNIAQGRIDYDDLKFAATSESVSEDRAIAIGDLLIVRTNGSRSLIGRGAVVRRAPSTRTAFASYLIRFRLSGPPSLHGWISTIWNAPFLRAWLETNAATSAGQYNLSMTTLGKLPIPIPPIAEQLSIVAEAERRLSVVDELEQAVEANLQRAKSLRQSILQRAFSGNL